MIDNEKKTNKQELFSNIFEEGSALPNVSDYSGESAKKRPAQHLANMCYQSEHATDYLEKTTNTTIVNYSGQIDAASYRKAGAANTTTTTTSSGTDGGEYRIKMNKSLSDVNILYTYNNKKKQQKTLFLATK